MKHTPTLQELQSGCAADNTGAEDNDRGGRRQVKEINDDDEDDDRDNPQLDADDAAQESEDDVGQVSADDFQEEDNFLPDEQDDESLCNCMEGGLLDNLLL